MNNLFHTLISNSKISDNSYKPLFFRINHPEEKTALTALLEEGKVIYIRDEILGQLDELVKCLNPSLQLSNEDKQKLIKEHLNGVDPEIYGVWVYFPWSKTLIHILDEEEFIEVRTNRNRNKITKEEQNILKNKIIGIIGLSVGQSIALTLAMERTCGELRLADFDTAELSNLNRIRTSTQNLGLKKTIIAAREILEIDPYLNVKIFSEGLNKENLNSFFSYNGQLDLLVEVCDGIDIKLDSRFKAKSLKIPVVMDTNDRGMLDIERFDLEPERPIFHGYLDHLVKNNQLSVTPENRLDVLHSILSFEDLSSRMKTSMKEIGKTINTWPQLASSVVLGGAITTDICRRILLDQHKKSGRYYVDLDAIFE